MNTRQQRTSWVAVAMALSFLLAAGRGAGQMDLVNVPDPSPMLLLAPEGANAGPPPCIRMGTRLTYWAMSASIPGAYKQLVQNDKGEWEDQNGQRWGEQDIPSSSGGGYHVLHVGYLDNQVVQLASRFYLFDLTSKTSMYSFGGGVVGHAGCASDYWVHPAVLQKMPEVNRPDIRILRMPFTAGGRRYNNAIVFHTSNAQGYKMRAYDLETGLMIAHGSRSQGAAVATAPPPGGGRAGTGAGSTMLTSGWLVEVKNVETPWREANPPAWVGQFQRLDYRGTISSLVPSSPRFDRPLAVVISPKARGKAWVRYNASMRIQSLQGIPPVDSSWDGACGPGSFGGLWIAPQALAALRPGQVLEKNQVVNTTTIVSRVGGGSITLTEAGPRHRIDCTYDAATGVLSATSLAQKVGAATITYSYQLARRP